MDDFDISASYKSRIISHIKLKLTLAIRIIGIGLLTFYMGQKIIRDLEKKAIKLFQLSHI